MVDAADEAAFGVAAEGVFEFEVAAAGGVDGEAVVAVFALRWRKRRQGLFVGVVEVLQQAAGGADGGVVVGDAVAVQGFGLVVLEEEVQGAVGVEVPVRLAARAFACAEVGQAGAVRDEDFRRAQALDFAFERVQGQGFAQVVARAADVRPGEVVVLASWREAEEDVVARLIEQGFVGQRAGGDDAGNGALNRPFGERRVADLFADDGGLPLFDEFGDVVVNGMHRHARHRDGLARALPAGGDADAEQLAAAPRVVKKEFVEVAHAVENEGVRVVFFDAEVLLHHRRVRGVFRRSNGLRHGVS